jgi:hypothetical protein
MRLLVVTSTFHIESAFGQFVKFFNHNTFLKSFPNSHNTILKSFPTNFLRNQNSLSNICEECAKEGLIWDKIICIGDYWSKEEIDKCSKCYEEVHQFNFDRPFSAFLSSGIIDISGPIKFCILKHEKLIEMLDDRIASKNTVSNQALFTGISNVRMDITEEERYYQLFTGELDFDYVIAQGQIVMERQLNMVKQRVLNFSRVGTLKNGMKYCISEAPELVNITHDTLKKQYPDCPITIILNIRFDSTETDEIAYSVRSWDGVTDVKEILQNSLGVDMAGGDKFAAGGRRKINLMIDF